MHPSPARPIDHLGINAVFLQPRMGGIETYVRRLVPAIAEARPSLRISVYVNDSGRELLAAEDWADAVELVTHPLLGRRGARALTELTLLGWLASRRQLDVLHSVALTAPLRTRATNVLTIADVTWLRHPDPAEWKTTKLWGAIVPPVARRADRIIVYTESTKEEVAEDLAIPLGRIDVVPLGADDAPLAKPTSRRELRERLRLGTGPIVLAVSALKIHKNVGRLIAAFPQVRAAAPDAVLVIPGNWTPEREQHETLVRSLGLEDAVLFPGWVSAADLEGLYAHASCFVFPSLREGFGLPLLEAMRRGLPVACSNTSAVPEVAGEAALFFDPLDVGGIAEAVRRLLVNRELAEELSRKGLERQRIFSWRRAAEETLASYARARP